MDDNSEQSRCMFTMYFDATDTVGMPMFRYDDGYYDEFGDPAGPPIGGTKDDWAEYRRAAKNVPKPVRDAAKALRLGKTEEEINQILRASK